MVKGEIKSGILIAIIISVLVISGIAMALDVKIVNNDKKDFNLFKKRVIADTVSKDDIGYFRLKGCVVRHFLKDATALECPATTAKKFIEATNVREDRIFHIADLEADQIIGADRVWQEGITGSGVAVAILDTGVDFNHAELSNSYLGGYDFVGNDEIPDDYNGHGTHVAGIITGNGVYPIDGNYAKGVSPNADFYMYKVCDDDGYCQESDMMAAMEAAVLTGARVMSISIGGGNFPDHCDSDPLAAKVNWVVDQGITVVVAAGNDGSYVSSPACASKAIAVGAVDKNDQIAGWSNRGNALDIVAPGVDILSSYSCLAAGDCNYYWYAYMSGTSMATPHVSGVIALLLDANPSLTTAKIKEAMYSTAKDLGEIGWDEYYGWGRVDAFGAVNYVSENVPEGDIEFHDSFEIDEWNGLWVEDSQNNWFISSQRTRDGKYSAEVDGLARDATLTMVDSIDLTGKNARLTFSWFIESYLDSGEYLCLDLYGGSWQEYKCLRGNVDAENVWHDEEIDLSNYLVNNFKLRFRAKMSRSNEDANVDNVKIMSHVLAPECTVDNDCDDGLFCNGLETCEAGVCQPGTVIDCSALGNQCNNGVCDESLDQCIAKPKPDNITCDDGLFCNVGETCQSGVCTGGSARNCDDNSTCTTDSCDEVNDVCRNTAVADGTLCDDDQFCTVNDVCTAGVCGGEGRDCSDVIACTVDTCDEANDLCVNTPDDIFCDDGFYCNGAETCDALLGCQAGIPIDCNDDNECTIDGCNEGIDACEYTPVEDNTACAGGICCGGTCVTLTCTEDLNCDDSDACTIDTCNDPGTCAASCSYEDVTACVSGDGCCPAGCDYINDSDCASVVKCWNAEYNYLKRSSSQFRKFCKCAQGEYGYKSYSYVRGRNTAYQYVDTGNNENWETKSARTYYPADRVKCSDGNWYYTNKDYYR